jgi:hypothetical protein
MLNSVTDEVAPVRVPPSNSASVSILLSGLFAACFPLGTMLLFTSPPGYHPPPFSIKTGISVSLAAFSTECAVYLVHFMTKRAVAFKIVFPVFIAATASAYTLFALRFDTGFLKLLFFSSPARTLSSSIG